MSGPTRRICQKDDQERLYGVNDEHKEERVVRLYAVEYEHCLHGEMPWTGTIRCGHYHGYASHDKGDESARQPKCEVASKHWNVRK